MKEQKIIIELERIETGKSVQEIVAENREWLLGESGLNGWQWYIDINNGVVLERYLHD